MSIHLYLTADTVEEAADLIEQLHRLGVKASPARDLQEHLAPPRPPAPVRHLHPVKEA